MRKLDSRIVIVIIFILAAGLYYFYSQTPRPLHTYGSSSEENTQDETNKKTDSVNEVATAGGVSGGVLASSSDATVVNAKVPEKLQKLQTWLAGEAKNLDQPHIDTKQKDLELKKMIENFSDDEKKLVLETSLDTKRPANERILSTYLLVLDQSQASLENLSGVASKALPDFGPVTAHSEAEIRRGQELAVRYMAIDELAKRAPNNPEALETLKNIVNSAESAEIRGYAQRVLKQIK